MGIAHYNRTNSVFARNHGLKCCFEYYTTFLTFIIILMVQSVS